MSIILPRCWNRLSFSIRLLSGADLDFCGGGGGGGGEEAAISRAGVLAYLHSRTEEGF